MNRESGALRYEKKIWGETAVIVEHAVFSLHHLRIGPRAYCSEHFHEHRYNGFFVVHGALTVKHFSAATDAVEFSVELRAGEYHEVAPGVWHQFETGDSDAEALEVYFPPDLRDADIIRRTIGGLRPRTRGILR